LSGVFARALSTPLLPVASAEDRLLILAADAVTGRPVQKLHARAQLLLDRDPGVRQRLAVLARRENMMALADLATSGGMARGERRGRLSYMPSVAVALRAPRARHALRRRLSARLSTLVRRPSSRPLLIAVSGMDGCGKSTVTVALEHRLRSRGMPVERAWARLGGEREILDPIARPLKRLLRRTGTTADPIAVAGPKVSKQRDERVAAGHLGVVERVWILLVALVSTRTYRRTAARRRAGVCVVCDRWTADAMVDLELRYGRHRLATWILRRWIPEPDLGLWLDVDPVTAAQRKPGDKAMETLGQMESRYAAAAVDLGLIRLDARLSRSSIEGTALGLVDSLLRSRDPNAVSEPPDPPRQTAR
jgi:thymidylate kinase